MKYFSSLIFVITISSGFTQSTFDFFNSVDNLFATHCVDGKVDYTALKSDPDLPILIEFAASNASPAGLEKSYLINVYNLFVISKITSSYPVGSPMDDSGFFTDKSFTLDGKKISLDHLENGILRKEHTDPRLHFSLVCGAIGCPPITNFAYREGQLDTQLDQQAKLALNNDQFVYSVDESKNIYLSEIFNWYGEDFGKNKKEVLAYINGFRSEKFDDSYRVQYYPYDWTLNDAAAGVSSINETPLIAIKEGSTSLQQFTAGSLLRKGRADITLFNTMYTENHQVWKGQAASGYRATFMTHLLQVTYGITKNKRINVGLDISFRSSGRSSDSTFSGVAPAFAYKNAPDSRVGITSVGVRVKVQPFKNVADFSIQSTFSIPTIEHPEGYYTADASQNLYWADWDRNIWWNQIFYTKTFGDFQLFTEMDFLFRFKRNESQIGMLDLPASVFLSYFPTNRITLYAMTQHVHRFTNDIDPDNPIVTDWVIPMNYTASGVGFKYQVLPNLNLEFLYTNFWRGRNSGLGNTFNLGIKFLTK
ncbi:MAG: DUF547 domain-containing protein [Crocinitomicaceae bacterium]|nr:DUF547 domain-containing protein [Flavobacteriales bacterium]NQZ37655.1 DUF547 domain-containing protein [Crocinitomicaceae bacterium]